MDSKVKIIKKRSITDNPVILEILKVAAYCRVSTDGEDQLNSYHSQVQYYTDYIQKNPNWSLIEVYADEAISGTKVEKRINFQRLITDSLNGKIDLIITKSISRFARNTLDTLKYVRLLKENKVAVFFEEENINTSTMDGELLLTILSSVAQQEVENISANVKKGIKMKMSRGELVGFNRCLGYNIKDSKLVVNEEEKKVVQYIFKRYLEGAGGKIIGRELEDQGILSPRGNEKWSATTILDVIKNEKYVGDLLQGKTYTLDPISGRRLANKGEEDQYYITDNHEPIISREDYEKAQNIRLRRARRINNYNNRMSGGKREKLSNLYAFSSKIYCPFCGSILSRKTWHSNTNHAKPIWQCSRKIKNGQKECPHSKGIEEKALEKAFLESYRLLTLNHKHIIKELLATLEKELEDETLKKEYRVIQNKINELIKKESDLVDMKLNNKITSEIYEKKYNEIDNAKIPLLERERSLKISIEDDTVIKNRIKEFKSILLSNKVLEEFDRSVFESIIDKMYLGEIKEDGTINPYLIHFIYKTGYEDKKEGTDYKSNKTSPQSTDDTCGVYSVDTKGNYVEILHFKLFHDYFAFQEDEHNFKKKVLKKYFKVSVVVDLVSGDTRK